MPPTFTRQMLRTSVLKTNAYWPFGNCSRSLYAAAIKAFVCAFRRRKEICSIYLRHGMVEAEWIPALSDIDLTLIVRSNLSDREEYDFLESFWTAYRALRFFFPMLGEVEILDENALAPWLAHSSCSPQSPSWVLLHGQVNPALAANSCPDWRRRALNCAIWIYLEIFTPCFAMPNSFINRQDLQRRARKILRLLQPILSEVGQCAETSQRSDPTELMSDVLMALEAAVGCFVVSESGTGYSALTWNSAEPNRCDFLPSLSCGEDVRSVINLKDGKVWVLLKNGLKRDEISRAIRTTQRPSGWVRPTPVLMSFCLFAYIVRQYYPFDYFNLLRHRTVSFGADPLAEIAPPDKAAFVNHTLDRIANTLTYTRSEELFSATKGLSLPLFEESLNRALAVRLVLRDDWVCLLWKDVVARSRSAFPECVRSLEEIKSDVADGLNKRARQASFRVFRSIATSIQDLLAISTTPGEAIGPGIQ